MVDYELSRIRYKGDPTHQWHYLPTTENGLMLLPLTREASRRLASEPYAPRSLKRSKPAYTAEETQEAATVEEDTL